MNNLSPIAQNILSVITESTKPPKKPSCIAAWTICDQLGIARAEMLCCIPKTEHDIALKELINAGLIEETPRLGCRYQLTKSEQQNAWCAYKVGDSLRLLPDGNVPLEVIDSSPRTAEYFVENQHGGTRWVKASEVAAYDINDRLEGIDMESQDLDAVLRRMEAMEDIG